MRFIFAVGFIGLTVIGSCTSCKPTGTGNPTGNANATGNSNENRAASVIETPLPEPVPSSTVDPNFKQCNPYLPLIPGSTARYSLQYPTGLQANPFVGVDQANENGKTVFIQRIQIVDKSGGLNKNEMTVQKYLCDNGRIKIIAENTDNNVEGHKTISENHYVDPAYIMLEPSALRPGATWSYSLTQTLQAPEVTPANSDRTIMISCAVQGEEDVTVPAGKFRALKVTKKVGKIEISEYYGRGMGLIKKVNSDGTTWELLSYSGLKPDS